MLTRRAFLSTAAALVAAAPRADARPPGLIIDTHIHLFAADRDKFPLHPKAPYDPPPMDLETYRAFAPNINHAVVVHPEPYQDDHSYLEHCFQYEPFQGFFKGTCLFDALDPEAPAKMKALTERWPGKIIALRVHATDEPGSAPTTDGPIKNRDLKSPEMKSLWRAATDLGLAIQMHFLPHHSAEIGALASEFSTTTVILDHLGRAGLGSDADRDQLMALGKKKNTVMKFSGVGYSSKTDFPHLDAKPVVQRVYDAFGPDRMIWGGVGYDAKALDNNGAMLDILLDFASLDDRAKVRGLTAQKLFGFGDPA